MWVNVGGFPLSIYENNLKRFVPCAIGMILVKIFFDALGTYN